MSPDIAPAISETTLIMASRDQVSSDLAGEAVILNLKNGVYYGLDPVGAFIWTLLQEPRTLADLHRTLLAAYQVEPEVCMQDLLVLLGDLAQNELIELRD